MIFYLFMKLFASLFFFVLIFVVFSCIADNHKQVIVKDPDGYYTEKYFVIDDSIKDGIYLKFYADGKLSDSCYYKNDTIQGIKHIFSDKGYLEIQETYKNGILDGEYKVFYPNGKVKLKQTFKDNVLTGLSYAYYDNGNLKEKVLLKNGIENGAFEEFYKSGKIHWKGTYLNGENEQDTLYEYDLTGEVKRKLFCRKGVCYTVWTKDKGFVKNDSNVIIGDELLDIPVDY